MDKPYLQDPDRADVGGTGIYVRAKTSDDWDSVDIASLDRDSLARFLNSRDAGNLWAVNCLMTLFNHTHYERAEFDALIAELAKVSP